ncbi:MAG: hypothetical protein KGN32_06215 [Burkholderiales bacterium]|nr:hypothetical protein [Burkholderiales bacterium]
MDRTQNVRQAAADLASAGANRVIPVAPVNPSVQAHPSIEPTPSVVNLVAPALKQKTQPTEGEPVYTSVADPLQKKTHEAASKDWTIHRPAPEKVEDPPPKPLSQVLMDHLRSIWTASASAIQVEQVKELVTPAKPAIPTQVPGDMAKQVLTYEPARIKKTENL